MRQLAICLIMAALAAPMAGAEAPPPYPDFTFKRVKPPVAGQKRITVQVPSEAAAATPDTPEAAAVPAPSGRYDWYWQIVSPALVDSGPGRLSGAVNALAQGPGGTAIAAPRLQSLQDMASQHGLELLKSSVGTDVSPALALAVMAVESNGKADALSQAGASGLMQLMPATATRFGVEDALDAAQNIRGGIAYLNWLMAEFDKDPVLVLAAYNAGENAVRQHDGVPPYAETRDYVPKVLAAWGVARGLCLTPPELISDGCVFKLQGS